MMECDARVNTICLDVQAHQMVSDRKCEGKRCYMNFNCMLRIAYRFSFFWHFMILLIFAVLRFVLLLDSRARNFS